jgi:hypothetical protein
VPGLGALVLTALDRVAGRDDAERRAARSRPRATVTAG